MRINFHGEECVVRMNRRYANGRVAIELFTLDGEPFSTATCNIPEEDLGEDEVFIKDYSENEGMLDALESAGIVKRTGQTVQSGYVTIPVARLLLRN